MAKAKRLPSGSWRVQVFSHTTENGKKVMKSFTAPTKKEAELLAAEFNFKKDRIAHGKMSLADAMDRYLESKSNVLSPNTLRGYVSHRRNSYKSIINLPTNKLNQEMVQKWLNEYALSHSPKSCSNAYGFLTAVLSTYEPNLALRIKLPQKRIYEGHIPSNDEVKILLEHIKGTELEKAVLLSVFGTMRRGEVCGARAEDLKGNQLHIKRNAIPEKGGTVSFKVPKTTKSDRYVEIPKFVLDRINVSEGGYLVDLKPDDISRVFKKKCEEAGVTPFRFQDLRKYSASILHALGVPEAQILKRGGWSSNHVMVSVYRRTVSDMERIENDRVNQFFDNLLSDNSSHESSHEKNETL